MCCETWEKCGATNCSLRRKVQHHEHKHGMKTEIKYTEGLMWNSNLFPGWFTVDGISCQTFLLSRTFGGLFVLSGFSLWQLDLVVDGVKASRTEEASWTRGQAPSRIYRQVQLPQNEPFSEKAGAGRLRSFTQTFCSLFGSAAYRQFKILCNIQLLCCDITTSWLMFGQDELSRILKIIIYKVKQLSCYKDNI